MNDLKTLVVDDTPEIGHCVERYLKKAGFPRTVYFEDPTDALRCIQNSREPVVIITDYHMPQMSGTQLLHAAELHHDDFDAVVMSASPEVENETAFPFIEKDDQFLGNIVSFVSRVAQRRMVMAKAS